MRVTLSQDTREDIAIEWQTLEDMVEFARWSWTEADVGYGQFESTNELTVSSLNLCVIFGLSILEKSLLRLCSEGHFNTRDSSLFGLMQASQAAGFVWRDFPLLDGIRRKRNEIAHQRARFNENECLVMLLAIAEELEELATISPRRRLFMQSMGLSALNAAGRRFQFDVSFAADLDRELQEKIFKIAEGVAKNMADSMNFRDELDAALTRNGVSQLQYQARFEFETEEEEKRREA